MNNPLFPLQWPPAPVADTSVRLPPLAEQATIALQDPLPVAYSYDSQSKRDAAFAHNTDPHISFLVLLCTSFNFPLQDPEAVVQRDTASTLYFI